VADFERRWQRAADNAFDSLAADVPGNLLDSLLANRKGVESNNTLINTLGLFCVLGGGYEECCQVFVCVVT